MKSLFMFSLTTPFLRWRRQKGGVVGKRYSQWNTNEPDLVDFDVSSRSRSPLTSNAFSACTNNPYYGCSINSTYSCYTDVTSTQTSNNNPVVPDPLASIKLKEMGWSEVDRIDMSSVE